MIGRIKSAWIWFTGGLAEAVAWTLDRLQRRPAFRIDVGGRNAAIREPDGTEIGRLNVDATDERFDPPSVSGRLAGAAIELSIPVAWLFRRKLDPVAVESVPFLDAFVLHQIERITPWRAADVHYAIARSPLEGDPRRVGVEIGVVPRRLLTEWIKAIEPLRPRSVRIAPQGPAAAADLAIVLGQDYALRLERIRRGIVVALLGLGLAYASGVAWVAWQSGQVRDEIEAQDRIMDERKAVLARAQRGAAPGHEMDAKLRDLRKSEARTVDVIEALARALPDSAHLTDFDLQSDTLTVSGVSTDMELLVPALESSGRFADVAFGAATTKVEAGAGDRFHLEMHVRGRMVPEP